MITNKRKIQYNETEEKLYACAKELFQKYGYKNVTVDSIVEAAGVSKGSFYVHFQSKNALLSQLIFDYINRADLSYETFLENIPQAKTASDILIALVEKIATYLSEDIGPESMTMLYEILLAKEENADPVLSYNRRLYKLFTQVITKGIDEKEFAETIDVDTIIKHSIISLRGLTYEWCLRYPDFDLKDHAVKHFQLLLSGISSK